MSHEFFTGIGENLFWADLTGAPPTISTVFEKIFDIVFTKLNIMTNSYSLINFLTLTRCHHDQSALDQQ